MLYKTRVGIFKVVVVFLCFTMSTWQRVGNKLVTNGGGQPGRPQVHPLQLPSVAGVQACFRLFIREKVNKDIRLIPCCLHAAPMVLSQSSTGKHIFRCPFRLDPSEGQVSDFESCNAVLSGAVYDYLLQSDVNDFNPIVPLMYCPEHFLPLTSCTLSKSTPILKCPNFTCNCKYDVVNFIVPPSYHFFSSAQVGFLTSMTQNGFYKFADHLRGIKCWSDAEFHFSISAAAASKSLQQQKLTMHPTEELQWTQNSSRFRSVIATYPTLRVDHASSSKRRADAATNVNAKRRRTTVPPPEPQEIKENEVEPQSSAESEDHVCGDYDE